QRCPDRCPGRGPPVRRRHRLPRRCRSRARARPLERPDVAPFPLTSHSPAAVITLSKKEPKMPKISAGRWTVLGAGALACALAVSACGAKPPSTSSKQATTNYTVLTPKPTAQAEDVVWATYRETQTLDPIQAFDYPENTVDPLLCDSLLRQGPDMTV